MWTRLAGVALAATLVASAASADSHAAIGTRLTSDRQHVVPGAVVARTIIINLPQRMLFYDVDASAGASPPFEVPIAIGRPTWQTPTGAFTIVEKRVDPVWHVPPSIMRESEQLGRIQPPVVPPGPNNPLGKYWLGTSLTGIGIHGTNAPSSISHAVTHGCMRVGANDIHRLFEAIAIDTPGDVIYEPILLARVGDRIYLEVNADLYHRVRTPPLDVARVLAAEAGVTSQIDWTAAAAVLAAHEGIAKEITLGPTP